MKLRRVRTFSRLRAPGDYLVIGPAHVILVCPVCSEGHVNGIEIHPEHSSISVKQVHPTLSLEPVVLCPWTGCLFMVTGDQAFTGDEIAA